MVSVTDPNGRILGFLDRAHCAQVIVVCLSRVFESKYISCFALGPQTRLSVRGTQSRGVFRNDPI
jgi:hypothetical protein